MLEGKRVKPHKLQVMRCSNGTFFSICTTHRCRCFTSDPNTIAKVIMVAEVLDITRKPIRKSYNRGQRNET